MFNRSLNPDIDTDPCQRVPDQSALEYFLSRSNNKSTKHKVKKTKRLMSKIKRIFIYEDNVDFCSERRRGVCMWVETEHA